MDVLSRLVFATVCVFSLVCLNACENAIPTSEFDSKSDGSNSPAGMNILVPIELTDNGMLSDVTPVTFSRTRTSLDTSYYDGAVTYSFEIVAKNDDPANKTVQLIDSADSPVAFIAIPASTISYTHFSVPFTPNIGSDNYRVVLPDTSSVDKVEVFTARIIVRQIGATKTRVYVPMYAFAPVNATHTPVAAYPTSGTSYGMSAPPEYTFPLWRYIASNLSQLATTVDPYTVEAVMSNTTSSGTAFLALHKFGSTSITASEVSITSSIDPALPRLITRSFSASEIIDNDIIEAKIKSSSAGNSARIHKAGLWIALENISKVEVYYRIGRASYSSTTAFWEEYRGGLDISNLSNPSGFFEICGQMGSGSTMELYDVAGSSGTSGPMVPGSSLSRTSRGISRTGVLFSPSLGLSALLASPYFIPKFNYVGGSTNISGAYLVIQFNK